MNPYVQLLLNFGGKGLAAYIGAIQMGASPKQAGLIGGAVVASSAVALVQTPPVFTK